MSDIWWPFMKIHSPRDVANKHGFRNLKKEKNPVSKGLNATSPKFSRSFFVWKSTYDKISWKSIRGCFRNVANRHDTAPSVGTVKQSSQVWNRLAICFVVGSNTSWKFHENLFTRFSVMLLANTDRENRKKILYVLNVTSLNLLDGFFCYVPLILKISWKSI